jgi:hypothetical protein
VETRLADVLLHGLVSALAKSSRTHQHSAESKESLLSQNMLFSYADGPSVDTAAPRSESDEPLATVADGIREECRLPGAWGVEERAPAGGECSSE